MNTFSIQELIALLNTSNKNVDNELQKKSTYHEKQKTLREKYKKILNNPYFENG